MALLAALSLAFFFGIRGCELLYGDVGTARGGSVAFGVWMSLEAGSCFAVSMYLAYGLAIGWGVVVLLFGGGGRALLSSVVLVVLGGTARGVALSSGSATVLM